MKTITKVVGACAAIATFTVQPQAPVSAASGVPWTNSAVDRVFGSGSDTTFSLMNDLASAYMESDGCLLTNASFPLTASSPTQNRCQSGTGSPIAGDNRYENYDHDTVTNYFPQGSNVGRGQLCWQRSTSDGGPGRDARVPQVDFARSSSAPSAGFQCTVPNGRELDTDRLRFVAFARDAISYTHWNTGTGGGANVNNLTIAQLRGIFITCTITDWGQVGGEAGAPIKVFTAIPGSGTRSAFEAFLGGGDSSACIPAQFKDGSVANGERVNREHQMEPIEQALNDPGAADEGESISYMSVGLHRSNPGLAANSLIGNVEGVEPNEANIVSGDFPFSRNMYNVIRQNGSSPTASGATRRFTGYLAPSATNGQSIGWICKGEEFHSEQVGNPSPIGIEDATATQDWYEIKQAAFAENGFYQLPVDPAAAAVGADHRCTFTDV